METKEGYLFFNRYSDKEVAIWNKKDNIQLGRLEYFRVGTWMSWVLFLNKDCYLSASCQDEVREVTKKLNANKYCPLYSQKE